MKPVESFVLLDRTGQAVAVQIKYQDWVEIEKLLASLPSSPTPPTTSNGAADINRFAGTVKFEGDSVAFQRKLRDEWE